MKISIQASGDECVINLPDDLLAAASIKPNDTLNVEINNSRIILSKAIQHRTLTERATDFDGELHLFEELLWDKPCGNEIW